MHLDSDTLRIVLADDHEVVRAGIKRLLSVDKTIKIVDEAANGEDAVSLVKYHKPDLALLDIFMPKMTGIEATKEIKEQVPSTYVTILTAFEDSKHLDQALRAGADAYLAKDISAKELIASLHKVKSGERVFSKSITKILQNLYNPNNDLTSNESEVTVSITKREQEILNLVALGKKSNEIADKLFISTRTVESHRYNLMQKLGIKNAAGLVRYAVLNSNMFDT